jgi:hypothetical protein
MKGNKYTRIQYFLWMVAGSEISALKDCPNEYNRHANIGLMILVTSLFAGFTAFIAGRTFAPDSLLGALGFAIVWAMVIFALDRSMVNSIKKNPEKGEESMWGYFWPRLILAFILSFFMSIPLDHIVFAERIQYQMKKDANQDWLTNREQLVQGFNVSTDSTRLKYQSERANSLKDELEKECEDCPWPLYKSTERSIDSLKRFVIPGKKAALTVAENRTNAYFKSLQNEQSILAGQPVATEDVKGDDKLNQLYAERRKARKSLEAEELELKQITDSAEGLCKTWKNGLRKDFEDADSLMKSTDKRLGASLDSINYKSNQYLMELGAMRGFDTQFVTLFTMPNVGVQVLKWLIFLALLVIEILPTYLKLKTPIGQYDMVMYQRERVTAIQVEAIIKAENAKATDVEDYRAEVETDLNKRFIDKVADAEERIAAEVLRKWEEDTRSKAINGDLGA